MLTKEAFEKRYNNIKYNMEIKNPDKELVALINFIESNNCHLVYAQTTPLYPDLFVLCICNQNKTLFVPTTIEVFSDGGISFTNNRENYLNLNNISDIVSSLNNATCTEQTTYKVIMGSSGSPFRFCEYMDIASLFNYIDLVHSKKEIEDVKRWIESAKDSDSYTIDTRTTIIKENKPITEIL